MIVEIDESKYNLVYEFAKKDIARNYFILLGLKSKKTVFDKIYGEYIDGNLNSILLKRRSGTIQFYAEGEFNSDEYIKLISKLDYKGMIGPKSYCDKLFHKDIFTSSKEGAYISKLDKNFKILPIETDFKMRAISVNDLDEIVEIYKEVFTSFAPKSIMEDKLKNKRGRGICIEKNGQILSLAQSDFEVEDGAIIVGIGTRKEYRCKGLATQCLQKLCKDLLEEGKDLYLQYDNLEAGKIYERQGFKVLDQVVHFTK